MTDVVNTPAPIDISKLTSNKDDIADQVKLAVITNDDEEQKAFDLLKIIKNAIKMADDERKEGTEWFRNKTTEINKKYNDEVIGPLEDLKAKLEAKIKPFTVAKQKRIEEEQREKQRKLEQEALEAAEKAEKSGHKEQADEVLEIAEKASSRLIKRKSVRSNYGAVTSSSVVYDPTVSDFGAFIEWAIKQPNPQDLIEIKLGAVKKLLNGDDRLKSIPGIEISEDLKITSR